MRFFVTSSVCIHHTCIRIQHVRRQAKTGIAWLVRCRFEEEIWWSVVDRTTESRPCLRRWFRRMPNWSCSDSNLARRIRDAECGQRRCWRSVRNYDCRRLPSWCTRNRYWLSSFAENPSCRRREASPSHWSISTEQEVRISRATRQEWCSSTIHAQLVTWTSLSFIFAFLGGGVLCRLLSVLNIDCKPKYGRLRPSSMLAVPTPETLFFSCESTFQFRNPSIGKHASDGLHSYFREPARGYRLPSRSTKKRDDRAKQGDCLIGDQGRCYMREAKYRSSWSSRYALTSPVGRGLPYARFRWEHRIDLEYSRYRWFIVRIKFHLAVEAACRRRRRTTPNASRDRTTKRYVHEHNRAEWDHRSHPWTRPFVYSLSPPTNNAVFPHSWQHQRHSEHRANSVSHPIRGSRITPDSRRFSCFSAYWPDDRSSACRSHPELHATVSAFDGQLYRTSVWWRELDVWCLQWLSSNHQASLSRCRIHALQFSLAEPRSCGFLLPAIHSKHTWHHQIDRSFFQRFGQADGCVERRDRTWW